MSTEPQFIDCIAHQGDERLAHHAATHLAHGGRAEAGDGACADSASQPAAGLRCVQATDTGDLDVVRRVLSLVPKDLDEATGCALSTCNYANVLGKAFG